MAFELHLISRLWKNLPKLLFQIEIFLPITFLVSYKTYL